MAKFCMKCGKPLNPGSKFCMHCGTPVPDMAEAVKEEKPKRTRKTAEPAEKKTTSVKTQKKTSSVTPAAKAKPKEEKQEGSGLKKVLLLVLAVELAVCALKYPGFLRKKEGGSTVVTDKDPYAYLSTQVEDLPAWPYHSDAVDITPVKGIRITAEKDQLFEDTKISLNEYDDHNEEILALNEQLTEDGIYMIGAWELDAGLEEGEVLPGQYVFRMDLDELGVPEELQECLSAYRIADDGQVYEFDSETKDGILTFSGNQNCPILLAVGLGGLVLTAAVSLTQAAKEELQKKWYYTFTGKGTHEGNHKYGKYKVVWRTKDVDYEQYQYMERLNEVEQACRAEAQKEFDEEEKARHDSLIYWFKHNESVNDRTLKKLKNNAEFKKYSQLIKMPEVIQMIVEKIDTAFQYLGSEGVLMPKHRVEFLVRNQLDKGNLGEETTALFHSSYILVGLNDPKDLQNSDVKKDNMLLTLTHELFHVCQENYRVSILADSNTFDEMATLVLESDAKDYYREEGIITTDPELTNTDNLLTLMNPMDNYHSSSIHRQQHGYVLKEFVMFLRKQTGRKISGPRLMANRGYWTKPAISEVLMKSFKISEHELDKYWRQWCAEPKTKKTFAEAWWEDREIEEGKGKLYTSYEEVKMKGNEGTRFAFASAGDYTAAVRVMSTPKDEMTALLIIMDSTAADDHPEMSLIPYDQSVLTKFGAFVEPGVKAKAGKWVPAQRRFLIESYGAMYGKKYDGKSGYTVWPMSSPEAPKVSNDKEHLIVRLPDNVNACGVIEGVRLSVANAEGKKVQYDIKKDRFSREIRVKLDDMKLKDTSAENKLTVTYGQYVLSRKGDALYIPESKPAVHTVEGDAETKVYSGLYLYADQICDFEADAYDREDDEETSYKLDSWPGGNTVKITGDEAEIVLNGVECTFHIQDKKYEKVKLDLTNQREAFTIKAHITDRNGSTWYGNVTSCPSTIKGGYLMDGVEADIAGNNITYMHMHGEEENTLSIPDVSKCLITLTFKNDMLSSAKIQLPARYKCHQTAVSDDPDEEEIDRTSESERTFTITIMK